MYKLSKKVLAALLTFVLILSLCMPAVKTSASKGLSTDALLDLESKGSFEFFYKEANTDSKSKGFGLIRDRAPDDKDASKTAPDTDDYNKSSVASVGFGLSALVIGAERGYITKDEARTRALGTLNTLLNNADEVNGFFYHFLDMKTAKRYGTSEVSIIDTAMVITGAITAGEYFGGEVKEKAKEIYDRVDWNFYKDKSNNQFYMGYSPEKGFSGHWDFYAEQLMLYILGAGSSTHPIDPSMFYSFTRHYASYGNLPKFINSWFGSIFTYQYSYSFIDFRNKIDNKGVNWWGNSVIASKASRQFAIDNSKSFKTLGENAWGLTACDGPSGYNGRYGSSPSGINNDQHYVDGTLAPSGALGSIVFTPQESIDALHNFYENYPDLVGKYGLKDSYNVDKNWYDKDVIGIDKGITLLMIENYRSGLVWKYNMENKNIIAGMNKVGLQNEGTKIFDDFDGNSLNNGWIDNGDKVYNIAKTNEISYEGTNSLKVDFSKGSFPWSCMKATPKNKALNCDFLSSMVYNASTHPLTLKLKLETSKGNYEKDFTIADEGKWEKITWDLSSFHDSLSSVNNFIIFAAPGSENETGSFYLDNIDLLTKVNAFNVFIDGNPIKGEKLTGNYNFYDTDGKEEGSSVYTWLRSDSNMNYVPIEGATGKTYTLTKDDVGKSIKFQVMPINSSGYKGFATESEPTKMADIEVPVIENLTITKAPVDEDFIIDDFSLPFIKNNWQDSGDKCYTLTKSNINELPGVKIDYNKKTEWGFFYYKFDKAMDLEASNLLSFKACGNAKFIMKFEDSKGNGIKENTFNVDSNNYKDFTWDLKDFSSSLKDVKRILIFAQPGEANKQGTFYLSDFKTKKRTIPDVTKDAVPITGETIYASYIYHDAKGNAEDGTSFKWFRSDEKDGQYTEIQNAVSNSYILTNDDFGKFIKVEVTPKSANGTIIGEPYLSAATNKISGKKDKNDAQNSNASNKPQNNTLGSLPKTGSASTLDFIILGFLISSLGSLIMRSKK